jgi:hypothetical protein
VITASELISTYDIVDATPGKGYVVVAEKKLSDPPLGELGQASASSWNQLGTTEYNADLIGQNGIRMYDQMRRGDGQIRGLLRLAKTPVLGARWFVEPASSSKQDAKVAKFVEDCLTRYMTMSWPRLLREILLELDFGWYAFEKVFDIYDGKVVWRKIAPRHPALLEEWIYDSNGGPNGARFFRQFSNQSASVFIPIEKLLVFTHEQEGGNMEGISVLRPAYKHWYYIDNLYKIDAIQKERHGIGVPVIKLPPNFSTNDKSAADNLGANLRTNERAHVVLPPMWDIMMLKMEGNPVDSLASAQHHGKMMYESILAGFMIGEGAKDGQAMFEKSCRFVADEIRDVFNKWAIPELVAYNWKTVDKFPELKVRRLGDTVDWRTISFAIRNFVGAGVIIPDDAMEDWVRDELDLPRADPTTKRVQATPQLPGGGGAADTAGGKAPRQAPAGKANKGAGSGKVGADNSGGK